jgi:hypothetical protein
MRAKEVIDDTVKWISRGAMIFTAYVMMEMRTDVKQLLINERSTEDFKENQQDFNSELKSAVNNNALIQQIHTGDLIRIKSKLNIE